MIAIASTASQSIGFWCTCRYSKNANDSHLRPRHDQDPELRRRAFLRGLSGGLPDDRQYLGRRRPGAGGTRLQYGGLPPARKGLETDRAPACERRRTAASRLSGSGRADSAARFLPRNLCRIARSILAEACGRFLVDLPAGPPKPRLPPGLRLFRPSRVNCAAARRPDKG